MIVVCEGTYSDAEQRYWLGVWELEGARVANVIGGTAQEALEHAWITFGDQPALIYQHGVRYHQIRKAPEQ